MRKKAAKGSFPIAYEKTAGISQFKSLNYEEDQGETQRGSNTPTQQVTNDSEERQIKGAYKEDKNKNIHLFTSNNEIYITFKMVK